jgi:hypothetical protein
VIRIIPQSTETKALHARLSSSAVPQESFLTEKISLDKERGSRLYAFRRKSFIYGGLYGGVRYRGGHNAQGPRAFGHDEEIEPLREGGILTE